MCSRIIDIMSNCHLIILDRNVVVDHEEPYPSLSDYHDYEPNLEFDDTELQTSVAIADAAKSMGKFDAKIVDILITIFRVFSIESQLGDDCYKCPYNFVVYFI